MYVDRYARREGIKPGSLAVAVALNAAVIGALLFSAPVIEAIREKPPLITTNIPLDPPPPPPPEVQPSSEKRASARPERVDTSLTILPTTGDAYVAPPPLPLPPVLPPLPTGEVTVIDPPPPAPVLVEARLDPRYARDLQPTYPAGERRAEREGTATVRVTIGIDGRVAVADCVAATSDDFCRATRAQALSKWRFRPATRDGVAVEASKVMTVRFELES